MSGIRRTMEATQREQELAWRQKGYQHALKGWERATDVPGEFLGAYTGGYLTGKRELEQRDQDTDAG